MFEADFREWYQRYPRKVGRIAAQKAYEIARRTQGATREELLAGVDAYVKHKPAYADFAHPRTWLSQGRWMDQWDEPIAKSTPAPVHDWWAECKQLHDLKCNGQYGHWVQMQIDAGKKAAG